MGKIKHNLNESYLQSLTEEERLKQMNEWSPSEWQQYLCPNGTRTLGEFKDAIYKKWKKCIRKNMVVIISTEVLDRIEEYSNALTYYPIRS